MAAMSLNPMMLENVWFDQPRIEKAEIEYQEMLAQQHFGGNDVKTTTSSGEKVQSSNLVNEIARARQQIQNTLTATPSSAVLNVDQSNRIEKLEKENADMRRTIEDLTNSLKKIEMRVTSLEKSTTAEPSPIVSEDKEPKKEEVKCNGDDDDDDDDYDFFDDDDIDEEEEARKEAERARIAKELLEKKKKKGGFIAKSSLILDVKPWDDETDVKEMERLVRTIEADGLTWGGSKFIDVAYGIKKLQIICIIEDDKISADFLEEEITKFEDTVQSMDIAAWNKL